MGCYLVTGGAGFIGSHLVRALVEQNHRVRVLDDFSTGDMANLNDVATRIDLIVGSVCDRETVFDAMDGVDYCLHHAAIASVPLSVEDPLTSNRVNVEGTLLVFLAARDRHVRRVIYASSSSVYGNVEVTRAHEALPLAPVSPYGVTKAVTELYAKVFSDLYGQELVGFRYFNVFGPRQDPHSQYAAVVPLFITRLLRGKPPVIYGDGEQSRDFTYVQNVVQANIRACEIDSPVRGIFNIASGEAHSVLDLERLIAKLIGTTIQPEFAPPRPGDIRHSQADITRAMQTLGYTPTISLAEGLQHTINWFKRNFA